jgi:hypothetical protein
MSRCSSCLCSRFTCFNSTKVQILTQKALQVLPKGTVQFEQVSEKRLKGLVHELVAGDGLPGSANQVVS